MQHVVSAASVERAPVSWLWRNRIPRGMLSLLFGRPGTGKSLFAAHLAAEVSRRGGVIFATHEDPLKQVARPRLEAAGAALERVHFWTPLLPEEMRRLADVILERDASLVVIDPIAAHLSVSVYNDQEVRTALTPLAQVAEETNAAILLLHHPIKNPAASAHPLLAVGGSGGGLAGAARVAYLWGRSPDDQDERVLACVKSNLGPEAKALAFELDTHEFDDIGDIPRLIPVGESEVTPQALLGANQATGKKAPEKLARACEFLCGYLRLGPRAPAEIKEDAQQHALSWMTIRRAADELGVLRANAGTKSVWTLPPELLALLSEDAQ
jgi:AAA domain